MIRLFLHLPFARQSPRCLFFALLWAALAGTGRVEAATIVVTSTADNGVGSLRAAIATASDGDTLQFDAALNGQTIGLTGGELAIDKNIIISGPGPNLLAVSKVSPTARFRIFNIMSGHTVTIAGLTISGGYADGLAGGIWNQEATLTISNCIVSGNFSDAGAGGGILSDGTLTIVDSIVSNNTASFTFGNPVGYGGGINGSGTLTIIGSTISNNRAAIYGGGIICGGMVTITDSTISGNRSGSDNLASTGLGGGIFYGNGSGMLLINNSTISGNIAQSGSESGGGGGVFSNGVVAIGNSTVSGNFAYDKGGAFYNQGTLEIHNSTFSGNSATLSADGIFSTSVSASAVLEIGNTILNNSGANIANDGGTVTSHGYNLSNDNGGGFLTAAGDQINTNAMLGPLQDNGGPTFTHNLLAGSPALNAGDPNFTPPPFDDQRGYARVFNGRIDIGSLEVQPAPTPSPTPTATTSPTPTATATATATATPSATQTPTPSATPTPSSPPARALNISTRLRVELGDRVMIGGFIITGSPSATGSGPSGEPKRIAVRGIGPSLAGSGISDTLLDPTLELRDSSGALLFQNDNWEDDSSQAAQLNALGLALQDPKESGIVAPLQPGASYTAILAGKNGGTGVGLVEIYDTNGDATSQLANISTRGFVQTGDNVMIGGFILGGSSNNTGIIVRGIGPSLSQSGLSNVLADPTLEVRDSNGMLLIANDNWEDDSASAAQLTAHGLVPQNSLESGIFASLPPGAFTAILAGKNGGTGIGLVEIYDVQ